VERRRPQPPNAISSGGRRTSAAMRSTDTFPRRSFRSQGTLWPLSELSWCCQPTYPPSPSAGSIIELGLPCPRVAALLSFGSLAQATSFSAQRNEPCRRHAFYHAARTVRFPPVDPAAEYRLHIAQLISAFGIGLNVRISHRTA